MRKRIGRCKHCEAFTAHRCHRCGDWLCVFAGAPCGKLRKVAGEVGRYDLVCSPRCRKTRKDIGVPKLERVGTLKPDDLVDVMVIA